MSIFAPWPNNPLSRIFTRPAPVDLSGLLQPTPYPISPLALLMMGAGEVKRARGGQLLEEEERTFRRSERTRTEEERKRQAARDQIDYWHRLYGGPQQAYGVLGDTYLQTTTAAGLGTPATRPKTAQIAQQRPEEGSLGRVLQPQGVQTIQVPGTELNIPAPQPEPPKKVAFLNTRTGQIQMMELPAGTDIQTYTPPGEPTRHVIVDRNGRIVQELPPGVVPHNLPQPPAGAQPAKLTPAQRGQLWQESYNRARDEVIGRPGLMTQINPPTPEQMAKVERRARVYFDQAVALALGQPQPGAGGGGGGAPGKLTPEDIADIQSFAADPNMTWKKVAAGLTQLGVTEPAEVAKAKAAFDAARKGRGGQPPPSAAGGRVSSDVANQARSLASALKRQRVDRTIARLRVLAELGKRDVNVGDPNVIAAVNAIMTQVYGR